MTKCEYLVWQKAGLLWKLSALLGLIIAGLVVLVNAISYKRWTDEVRHLASYGKYVIGFIQYFTLLIAIPMAITLLTWLAMIRSGKCSIYWIILWLIPMLGLLINGYFIGWLIEAIPRAYYIYYPMFLWQAWVAWQAYKLRMQESKGITNQECPDSNR